MQSFLWQLWYRVSTARLQFVTSAACLAAYQKKVKESIFIKEISKAKKERDSYLAEIDRAKKHKAIMDRKRTVRPQLAASVAVGDH